MSWIDFFRLRFKSAAHADAGGALFDSRQFRALTGYSPLNSSLFIEALSHRSFKVKSGAEISNERLEFLGDAVLNVVVAEYLYEHYPHNPEGELTKMRARLVNRKTLAAACRGAGLHTFLLLGGSALQLPEQGAETVIADEFEALVGAVYLDGGMKGARRFICNTLLKNEQITAQAAVDENYKSLLLEYAQSQGYGNPRYSIVTEDGPEHDKVFTVVVSVNNESMGEGAGKTKKEAEQQAAYRALKRVRSSGVSHEADA